jgi:hypothetical protein
LSVFCASFVALDQDVKIVARPHRDTKNAPALHVF